MKKQSVMASPRVTQHIHRLSKAALADLVVDLLIRMEGESMSDHRLLRAFQDAAGPVLINRGDSVPAIRPYLGRRERKACLEAT